MNLIEQLKRVEEAAEKAKERAEEALDTLASGSDPLAYSGYGYEHMGDMARDLKPLAQDVLTLCNLPHRTVREIVEAARSLDHMRDADMADLKQWREFVRRMAALHVALCPDPAGGEG